MNETELCDRLCLNSSGSARSAMAVIFGLHNDHLIFDGTIVDDEDTFVVTFQARRRADGDVISIRIDGE